eukprot:CAMPEP_0118938246 /NCGR_PEP_ID=MMETSP1169-20130426/25247_1 /TAXON_ID=36882 /ORGANISM="Pyramimonas obovata, Strain CCMP722" /LENGTH=338 /DNA_ID=CAMNT_0006882129 /DNA_START=149 /DNA_END=1162 /DNA_ORIENTATION=-
MSREVSGRDASVRDVSGRDASRRDTSARIASSRLASARHLAGIPPSNKKRSPAVLYEIRLQEVMAACGCTSIEPNSEPNVKRLSCHFLVLRELFGANAFGPLQKLMVDIVAEFKSSIYTDEMVSSNLPMELRGSDPESSLEPVPYFVELEECKKELAEAKAEAARAVVQLQKAELEKENAFAKLKGEGPESERKTQMINLLEYEIVKGKSEIEELKEVNKTLQANAKRDIMVLEGEVGRWKKKWEEVSAEKELLNKQAADRENVRRAFSYLSQGPKGEEAEVAGQLAAAKNAETEALKLEGQLLVLQNARVAEYEAMLDSASNRQAAKGIRAAFVEEM